MSNNVFKVVLLQALPASGKSEVRNFMAHVEPDTLRDEFRQTAQQIQKIYKKTANASQGKGEGQPSLFGELF